MKSRFRRVATLVLALDILLTAPSAFAFRMGDRDSLDHGDSLIGFPESECLAKNAGVWEECLFTCDSSSQVVTFFPSPGVNKRSMIAPKSCFRFSKKHPETIQTYVHSGLGTYTNAQAHPEFLKEKGPGPGQGRNFALGVSDVESPETFSPCRSMTLGGAGGRSLGLIQCVTNHQSVYVLDHNDRALELRVFDYATDQLTLDVVGGSATLDAAQGRYLASFTAKSERYELSVSTDTKAPFAEWTTYRQEQPVRSDSCVAYAFVRLDLEHAIRRAQHLPVMPSSGHSATLLSDGRVLVAGGLDAHHPLVDSSIYDPETNSWKAAAFMNHRRFRHSAVRLDDGSVLVVNGNVVDLGYREEYDRPPMAEIYNPARDTWNEIGPSPAHANAFSFLLDHERVLVVNTFAYENAYKVNHVGEVYLGIPAKNKWETIYQLPDHLHGEIAAQLENGQILIAGGEQGSDISKRTIVNQTWLYDPRTNQWTQKAPMLEARTNALGFRLSDNRVVVAGGFGPKDIVYQADRVEIYDPSTDRWILGARMPVPIEGREPYFQQTAGLSTQGYLVITGVDARLHSIFEVYNVLTQKWSGPFSLPKPHIFAHPNVILAPLHNGKMLATGDALFLIDPAKGTIEQTRVPD